MSKVVPLNTTPRAGTRMTAAGPSDPVARGSTPAGAEVSGPADPGLRGPVPV